MIHIGLFEGIGGFSVAAHWMGWQTVACCEIAEIPACILNHYFPDAYHHGDVKTLTYDILNEELSKRRGVAWRNESIKGYGNAVVPELIFEIFKAVQEFDDVYQECKNKQ